MIMLPNNYLLKNQSLGEFSENIYIYIFNHCTEKKGNKGWVVWNCWESLFNGMLVVWLSLKLSLYLPIPKPSITILIKSYGFLFVHLFILMENSK